jgi:hypothetical protein
MYFTASGLMSWAYTIPLAPTRAAARTENHPDPAPISATDEPALIAQQIHYALNLQPLIAPGFLEDRQVARVGSAGGTLRLLSLGDRNLLFGDKK